MILVELYPDIQRDEFSNIDGFITINFLRDCFDIGINKKKHFKENEKILKNDFGDFKYVLVTTKIRKKDRLSRRLNNFYNWSFSLLTVKKIKVDFDLFGLDDTIKRIKSFDEE